MGPFQVPIVISKISHFLGSSPCNSDESCGIVSDWTFPWWLWGGHLLASAVHAVGDKNSADFVMLPGVASPSIGADKEAAVPACNLQITLP